VVEKRYKNKIFAPSLSPNGKYLSVVKLDSINRSSLLLLSPKSGELIRELSIPENLFLITPSWSEENDLIYAVILGDKGKTIAKIDPLSGAIHYIFPFSTNEFTRPIERGHVLYYSASLDGIDNIYGYNIDNNKNYKLTSSRFGARDVQLSFDGTALIYSDYSANGYRIVSMPLKDALYTITDPAIPYHYGLADLISKQERGIPDFMDPDSTQYLSRRYSKLGNLFNFHSWAPVHVDTESEEIRPGLSLLSQNKLSTAITQLGYDYSTTNQTGKWVAKFDYTGLFPELKLDLSYGNEKSSYAQIINYTNSLGNVVRVDTQLIKFSYKILDIQSKINLPINLTHGKMYRYIQPEFQLGYTHLWQESSTPDNFFSGSVIPLTYRVYGYNLLKLSQGDLQSRFGQIIDLTYRNSPFGDRNFGNIWSTEGFLYLPGFARHNGIRVYGGYQKRNGAESTFSDLIDYPRGYSNIYSSELFTLRTDYVLPLFYPDWSLGKLSYFKRFSLRLFYDYASAIVPVNNDMNQYRYNFSSTGGEITTDCNLLRLSFPSKLGFRSSYLLGQKSFNFEFLFSVDLGSM